MNALRIRGRSKPSTIQNDMRRELRQLLRVACLFGDVPRIARILQFTEGQSTRKAS